MNVCKSCGHNFGPFEHYVKVGEVYVCEQCFWEQALKKFDAKEVKNDYQGKIDEDYQIDSEDEINIEYIKGKVIELDL